MKRILLDIRRWRDRRFLRRLERVMQENIVKASPILDGYVVSSGDMIIYGSSFHKPIDRIRYDIEHPNPATIEITCGGLTTVGQDRKG